MNKTIFKFDADTEVVKTGEGSYKTQISTDWNIAAPNGGYLLAIVGKAVQDATGYAQPLSVSATFHQPVQGGTATIEVLPVFQNRRLISVKAVLLQEGKELLSAMATFTIPQAFKGFSVPQEKPQVPAIDSCTTPTGIPFAFFRQIEMRVPEEQLTWTRGKTGGDLYFSGHFSFKDKRPLDSVSLLLFADASPPPVLRYTGPLAWVPTIEFSIQVRGEPQGDSIAFISRSRFVKNGLCETDIELYNSAGEILALGRQIALIKARNI